MNMSLYVAIELSLYLTVQFLFIYFFRNAWKNSELWGEIKKLWNKKSQLSFLCTFFLEPYKLYDLLLWYTFLSSFPILNKMSTKYIYSDGIENNATWMWNEMNLFDKTTPAMCNSAVTVFVSVKVIFWHLNMMFTYLFV